MFAEDVDLLPDDLFKRMLDASLDDPDQFVGNAAAAVRGDGEAGRPRRLRRTSNGSTAACSTTARAAARAERHPDRAEAAEQDWSEIDPSIMGTLFERGLDPASARQLGAHYTDPEKIMMIVRPVIIEPLLREWEAVKAEVTVELAKVKEAREARPEKGANAQRYYQGQRRREENALRREHNLGGFLDRLKRFRVLDPACGSGNFLYLGLKALKDIELRANQDHEALSLSYGVQIGVYTPSTGPENMLGIEINPFAVELARVSVSIGGIQWMREHGFDARHAQSDPEISREHRLPRRAA